eukprot:4827045-Ditylum_brightwellii.AAC.1
MQIAEDGLKLSKSGRNLDRNKVATNMYISLWKSLACPIKTAMQMHANSHITDSFALLYHPFGNTEAQLKASSITNNSA